MNLFRELSKDELKAMAGWASVHAETVPDTQKLALWKFREGCEALIEFAAETTTVPVDAVIPRPEPREDVIHDVTREWKSGLYCSGELMPSDVAEYLHLGGKQQAHQFDLHSQRCVFCGKSRRQHFEDQPDRASELATFQT